MTICLIFISLLLSFGCFVSSVEYLIQNNDRILFVGGTTTFLGDINPSDFINLLRLESNVIFSNVTISNCVVNTDTSGFDFTKVLQDSCLLHYKPNKAILVIKFSDTKAHNSVENYDLTQHRFALESTVSFLTDLGVQVILCSTEMKSEFIDSTDNDNPHELFVEEFVWLTKQVARDYGAMHIDLHTAILKYQETTTIEGLPHSFLTHDDGILSEVGHAFVAQILVERLLGSSSDFIRNNAAAVERRRVATISDSLRLMSVSSSGGVE
jgi:hypothetical protein